MLNDNVAELGFNVQNYGYFLWDTDLFTEMIAIYESLPIGVNDIVIIQTHAFKPDIDVVELGKPPHNYGELFWDAARYTENGCALLLEKFLSILKEIISMLTNIAQYKTQQ